MMVRHVDILYGVEAKERMRGEEERMRQFILSFPGARARIASIVDPAERETEIEYLMETDRQTLGDERVAIAVAGKDVVAMSGNDYIGNWIDGRLVYEIGSVATAEDERFRNRHLSSLVQDRCMQEVLRAVPCALFLVCTANPKLIARYGRWHRQSPAFCRDIGAVARAEILRRKNGIMEPLLATECRKVKLMFQRHKAFLIDFNHAQERKWERAGKEQ